ncbi:MULTISPECIES: SCP2 sterol-binding domain-containing protein [Thermoactinomyces]|jgi:putative sterol carrier protein|uniref:SCP2 sterol-binding domain-containing protein n=1 Tax=Thermoactinomyces daqus TaxID=1329516 RepID=A0A7W1XBJ3_9BACL|nr:MULTISPECIES: SCP2 sterol-binding domain-containing protein [Thermoactinomyces]MBA4543564.1 SCP2 sterol-binding domain-containing protein [Thermoactinomyces daqus]MBH8596574.1 SCP2 sterol-binding domain-containing protein [Thermoactinomyces sp. CICC 10523]MBH8603336.1 SCP2 sterol-binding domain-containing protein [Thermoactinomyces sp. CICC 10522]MBH8607897.1 SCP2 sterol-binding domain-containing protein [Thermoactinomyces sp. CICC 10521]
MTKAISVDEIFQLVEKALKDNPKPVQDLNVVYQFDLSGDDGGTYQLHLNNGTAKVEKGASAKADCILQMSVDNFKELLLGNLSGTAAFMTGKLKVKGNIGLALKLENILRQYDPSQYLS